MSLFSTLILAGVSFVLGWIAGTLNEERNGR